MFRHSFANGINMESPPPNIKNDWLFKASLTNGIFHIGEGGSVQAVGH